MRAKLVERWLEERATLKPLPISPSRQEEVIPLILEARNLPQAKRHGVIFVDNRLGPLLYCDGYCHVEAGDYASAERTLRELLALAPATPRAYGELTTVLGRLGKHDEAVGIATEGPGAGRRALGLASRTAGS